MSKKLSLKEQLRIANERIAMLESQKSQKAKAITVSTDKNSILHFSSNTDMLLALASNEKAFNDFVISDKEEEEVTKAKLTCRVMRVKLSFRQFASEVIVKAIKEYS